MANPGAQTALPQAPEFEQKVRTYGGSPPIEEIERFLPHLAKVYGFLATSGIALLRQKEPLSAEEWLTLWGWVFQTWNWGRCGHVDALVEQLAERGINDLARFISTTQMSSDDLWKDHQERGPVIGEWVLSISHGLLCQERMPNEETRNRLINLMAEKVLLPLRLKGVRVSFNTLAVNRFPGDGEAQKMFEEVCERRVTTK